MLHVNALFVAAEPGPITLAPVVSQTRGAIYGGSVDRALALGGIAQLNHPNFHHGADLEVLLTLAARGLTLVEIENQAVDSNNEGTRGMDRRRRSGTRRCCAARACSGRRPTTRTTMEMERR